MSSHISVFLYFFLGPSESDNFSHNLRGVIPRSFEYLFSLIEREKEKVKLTVKIKGIAISTFE